MTHFVYVIAKKMITRGSTRSEPRLYILFFFYFVILVVKIKPILLVLQACPACRRYPLAVRGMFELVYLG
jgi:hypothetical protein